MPVRALEAVGSTAGSGRRLQRLATFGLVLQRPLVWFCMLHASHFKASWPCSAGSMSEIAAGLCPCYNRRPAMLALPTSTARVAKKVMPNQWAVTTQHGTQCAYTTPREFEFDRETALSACGKRKVTPNQGNLTTRQHSAEVVGKAGPKMSFPPSCVVAGS